MSLCDPDDLRTALGSATVDTDLAAVQESCDAATSYVMAVLGADTIVLPYPPAIRRAAMVCAVRIYQDPKSPFGVIGGPSEVPMYSKGAFPDVDAMLLGWRLRFGLA